jgi:hypothetical protein
MVPTPVSESSRLMPAHAALAARAPELSLAALRKAS